MFHWLAMQLALGAEGFALDAEGFALGPQGFFHTNMLVAATCIARIGGSTQCEGPTLMGSRFAPILYWGVFFILLSGEIKCIFLMCVCVYMRVRAWGYMCVFSY